MTARAVITGCNVAFAPGAVGLLRSAREFHPDVARYCLCPPGDLDAVRAVVGDLATVLPPPRPVAGVPDRPILQLLAARAFVPEFPHEVVAWVDCDAVFCGPADRLWDVPAGVVNAVADAVYSLGHMVPADVWDAYAAWAGAAKTDRGFNAGVYALRAADWPDLPRRYEAAVAPGRFPYYPPGFDQAVLNALFRGRVNWLPREFNAHATFERGVPRGVKVLHYTDNPKPWMPGYGRHRREYYHWVRFAEQAGPARAAAVRAHTLLRSPQRLAYKAWRKVMIRAGVWESKIGVGTGPGATP
jgi:hypothetical protein